MLGKKFHAYMLIAAFLPALAIALPTSQAQAKDGRHGAFIAGLVAGAVGGAVLYHESNRNWNRNRIPNHYHRDGFRGCHTHNGVYHCHNRPHRFAPPPIKRNFVPPRVYRPDYRRPEPRRPYYGRPEPWTREWHQYCHNKYRSFDSRTGYYTTYSGRKRFCR